MVETERALILALINDLFFGMRVRNTAEQLGYSLRLLESQSDIEDGAAFITLLKELQPKLIVLDLHSNLLWQDWLMSVKTDESLREIPWLAFGSHKSSGLLKEAKQLGADKVVAKSKFTEDLPKLIQSLTGD